MGMLPTWHMNRFIILLLVLLTRGPVLPAQAILRDTSFSVYSEYRKLQRSYPQIRIAETEASVPVKQQSVRVSCKGSRRPLQLEVFRPSRKTQCNGIGLMIVHGGGWRSGHPLQHAPLAQRLAALGYTCFLPEYRLSAEAPFPAAVHDLKAALRWIRKHAARYALDTARLAVAGFSAGGELAAFLGATRYLPEWEGPDCPDGYAGLGAVIDIDGILSFIHPESGEGDDSRRISAATHWLGYPKNERPELWRTASPLTWAGAATPPTLFLNSSVARMHAGRDDYIRLLTREGIYTEVQHFNDAPHAFCLFHPWFETTVVYMDAFLRKVFGPAVR